MVDNIFSVIDTAIIFIVMTTSIIIGFASYRMSKTLTGFIFANKTLGSWLLAFSIMATYFSAASFLGGGGATYLYNLGFGAWLTAWHVIGVVLLWILVAARLFNYISKTGIMSIPELIGHRYKSRAARVIASAIIIILFSLYLAGVYKGGAIVLSTQLGLSLQLAMLLLALPVIIYIVVGGLKAATLNNLFLGLIMLIAAGLTFSYIMSHVRGFVNGINQLAQIAILNKSGTLWLTFNGMGPQPAMEKNAVSMLIMSIAFSIGMAQIALPNILIHFYAAKDRKTISRGRIIGPILVSLYAMLMFSLGAFCHLILDHRLSAKEITELMKNTDWVIPKTVSLITPPIIRGFIFAAPAAASMSTIALTVLTLSNTFLRDVVQTLIRIEEKRILFVAKAIAMVFALVPIPVALTESKIIVDIVGAAFGTIFACFVGPVVMGLYWEKASKEGTIISMVLGALVGITWYLYLYRKTWIYPTVPATIIALISFVIPTLIKSYLRKRCY